MSVTPASSMTAASDVTATRGKRRGKVDINMDISGSICHRALIILFLESSEVGEDNAVSDMRASESEKYLSSLLHNNAAGPTLCALSPPSTLDTASPWLGASRQDHLRSSRLMVLLCIILLHY